MRAHATLAATGEAAEASALPPSFDEVFATHAAFVMRALRCLGARESEAEDACQDVFVVVHRRLSELESPAALRAWLYAICVKKALSL